MEEQLLLPAALHPSVAALPAARRRARRHAEAAEELRARRAARLLRRGVWGLR
jgi:hypothetical protein